MKELTAKFPGLLIEVYESPQPLNVDVALVDQASHLSLVWHNPIVLAFMERGPRGASKLLQAPGELPVWISPPGAAPGRKFEVKTRNCVPDGEIQQNVLYSMTLGLPCLPRTKAHGERALVVSAGPSLVNAIEDIRQTAQQGGRLVCVKHSHDMLLDAGITPWACVLLDPRAHVKDFVEEPAPGVKYFVSSTCHPSSFDRLLSRGAEVWLYHALVGAGEQPLIAMYNQTKRLTRQQAEAEAASLGLQLASPAPYNSAEHMVSGGTTAASRGLSVLHMLGFRHFVLWAFDSCLWEKPDLSARKEDGQPRYHELNLGGRTWWTDAELYAQVQDFQNILPSYPDCTFEPRGDGMIPHLIRSTHVGIDRRLEDVFPVG